MSENLIFLELLEQKCTLSLFACPHTLRGVVRLRTGQGREESEPFVCRSLQR